MTRANPAGTPSEWRHFVLLFLGVAALAGLACIGFVATLDPYGLRAGPGRAPGPLMDGNQRFMYPQVARSGAYDGAVFGTSTLRLLDPAALERAFGGRFANLSMNAATPYEQAELARLYLRHNRPKALVFGIDPTWCEPEAAERRLTFRAFPAWLYRPDAAWGVLRQVNGQSVSTAADALLSRLGIVRARLAANGYAVFTPPEGFYDAARAQAHIRSARAAQAAAEAEPGYRPTPADAPMPALGWLDALLAQAPPRRARSWSSPRPRRPAGRARKPGGGAGGSLQGGGDADRRGAWRDGGRFPHPLPDHATGHELLGSAALPPADRGADRGGSEGGAGERTRRSGGRLPGSGACPVAPERQ